MNIVQITPGAGRMFCGACFRDNSLVAAWRQLGHNPTLLPLYLPMTLDEEDQSQGAPVFFGGINVYLQQKSALFGKMPAWLHRLLDSPRLLGLASGAAAKTRPEDVGELTVSMLKGEEGHQQRELNELVTWLKEHFKPDVICLSNALLLGLTRKLRRDLNTPVVCLLAGEDSFLDALPEPARTASWQLAQERAGDVDMFIAPSRYFAGIMSQRLRLTPKLVKVVYGGVNLDGFVPRTTPPNPPVLGYFARMCKDKGLPTLVDAFIQLKRRDRVKGLRLKIGGGLSPSDEAVVVRGLRDKMGKEGVLDHVEFCPNLSRAEKLAFYQSLSVLSVPALYGEAFGLYLAEAWASSVPVVQPRHAAFPELIDCSQAGLLCEPDNAAALADCIEQLLLDPGLCQALGQAGRKAAVERFNVDRMAREMVAVFHEAVQEYGGRASGDPTSKSPVSRIRSASTVASSS